jgi:hypothetical protein
MAQERQHFPWMVGFQGLMPALPCRRLCILDEKGRYGFSDRAKSSTSLSA